MFLLCFRQHGAGKSDDRPYHRKLVPIASDGGGTDEIVRSHVLGGEHTEGIIGRRVVRHDVAQVLVERLVLLNVGVGRVRLERTKAVAERVPRFRIVARIHSGQ